MLSTEIGKQTLKVDLSKMFHTTLYLKRETNGKPLGTYRALKKLSFESCGNGEATLLSKNLKIIESGL